MLGRIAVHLDNDRHLEKRVQTGARLAAQHNCELVGIYAGLRLHRPALEEIVVPAEIKVILERSIDAERKNIREIFAREIDAAGVEAFWRTQRGAPEDILARESRYCDLLVMSQPDDQQSDASHLPRFAAAVILAAGRPVLMLPNVGQVESIGKRVMVCWDQGREAARALADATPILEEAKELIFLTVDPQSRTRALTDDNRDDLLAYCDYHGFPPPRIVEQSSGATSVGESIVHAASDAGVDLIIMGAYGHSRLQQAILGGTTRKMFESMRTPVLFSH